MADTGKIADIKRFHPTDATTNPSLILQAADTQEYQPLINDAIAYGKSKAHKTLLDFITTKICANAGVEILKYIPGRISTEIDARLSFDIQKTIDNARQYIKLYTEMGIDKERILIKIPATWEGIVAAKQLEQQGIHCNMTLIFNWAQVIACAQAQITLISPFIGRILDWHKKTTEQPSYYLANQDPGVIFCTQIFNYYKNHDYQTQIMGASLRNKEEILELAGIDLLTIPPMLLQELQETELNIEKKLFINKAKVMHMPKSSVIDEKNFRFMINEDPMATEKLAEGIRIFVRDTLKLEEKIQKKL